MLLVLSYHLSPFMIINNLFRNFESSIVESINVVDIYLTKSSASLPTVHQELSKSDTQSAPWSTLIVPLTPNSIKNLLISGIVLSSSLYSHMPFRNLSHQLCLIAPYRICLSTPIMKSTTKIVDYHPCLQVELGNQLTLSRLEIYELGIDDFLIIHHNVTFFVEFVPDIPSTN